MAEPPAKLTEKLSKPISLILTVAVTAMVTWYVQRALTKPRLHASILRVELPEADEGGFSLEDLVSLEEFFKDNQEVQQGMRQVMTSGIGDATESLERKRSAAFELKNNLSRQLTMRVATVRSAVGKAADVLAKLESAKAEVELFLAANPRPDPSKVTEYGALFKKFDKDEDLTAYTPNEPSPAAGVESWYGVLVEMRTGFDTAAEINRHAINSLRKQLDENARKAAQGRAFVVHALVTNTGDSPAAILGTAMLEAKAPSNLRSNLTLTADTQEPLVIPARGHLMLALRTSREVPDAESDDWKAALALFPAGSARCTLKLLEMNESIVISDSFPFYSGDTYRKVVVEKLRTAS